MLAVLSGVAFGLLIGNAVPHLVKGFTRERYLVFSVTDRCQISSEAGYVSLPLWCSDLQFSKQ